MTAEPKIISRFRKAPAEGKKLTRRSFLLAAGEILLMTGIPHALYAWFVDKLLVRTVESEAFKFNPRTGSIKWAGGREEKYRLLVDGLVKEPAGYSYQDLKAFSQVEQVSDFHCVEGWSVPDIKWGGFRFSEIVRRNQSAAQATHIVFHALGKTSSSPKGQSHYIESLSIKELLNPENRILLALNMNGQPLSEEHGAPLRLVVPSKYGYKSIKFVTRIEFVRQERPGWWTLANPVYSTTAEVPAGRLRARP